MGRSTATSRTFHAATNATKWASLSSRRDAAMFKQKRIENAQALGCARSGDRLANCAFAGGERSQIEGSQVPCLC